MQLSGDSPNQWVGRGGRILAGRLRSRRPSESITSFTVQPSRADLEYLTELIESGAVRTHIGETWDLDEVGKGLERLEAGHAGDTEQIEGSRMHPTARSDILT